MNSTNNGKLAELFFYNWFMERYPDAKLHRARHGRGYDFISRKYGRFEVKSTVKGSFLIRDNQLTIKDLFFVFIKYPSIKILKIKSFRRFLKPSFKGSTRTIVHYRNDGSQCCKQIRRIHKSYSLSPSKIVTLK